MMRDREEEVMKRTDYLAVVGFLKGEGAHRWIYSRDVLMRPGIKTASLRRVQELLRMAALHEQGVSYKRAGNKMLYAWQPFCVSTKAKDAILEHMRKVNALTTVGRIRAETKLSVMLIKKALLELKKAGEVELIRMKVLETEKRNGVIGSRVHIKKYWQIKEKVSS